MQLCFFNVAIHSDTVLSETFNSIESCALVALGLDAIASSAAITMEETLSGSFCAVIVQIIVQKILGQGFVDLKLHHNLF